MMDRRRRISRIVGVMLVLGGGIFMVLANLIQRCVPTLVIIQGWPFVFRSGFANLDDGDPGKEVMALPLAENILVYVGFVLAVWFVLWREKRCSNTSSTTT